MNQRPMRTGTATTATEDTAVTEAMATAMVATVVITRRYAVLLHTMRSKIFLLTFCQGSPR